MKNTLMYLFVIAVLFSVISCEKDDFSQAQFDNTSENIEDSNQKSIDCDFSSIAKVGNKLSFIDMNHFRETLECLEEELEKHHEGFDGDYVNTPVNQLDSIADLIGFDDWGPLVDFENQLSFSSRRNYIELLILDWLDNDDLDFNNDPDELDDLDEELRTLLNVDGEVMIEGKVYNYLNTEGLDQSKSENCSNIRSKSEDLSYNSSANKVKLSGTLSSTPFLLKQKAKVVNFKRKKNGKWKRARTTLTIQSAGLIRDEDCNFPISYGSFKGPKNRKSLKTVRRNWDPPTNAMYEEDEGTASCTMGDGWSALIVI